MQTKQLSITVFARQRARGRRHYRGKPEHARTSPTSLTRGALSLFDGQISAIQTMAADIRLAHADDTQTTRRPVAQKSRQAAPVSRMMQGKMNAAFSVRAPAH